MQRLLIECEFKDAPGLSPEQKHEILQGTAEARNTTWEDYRRRRLLPLVSQGSHTRKIQKAFQKMGLSGNLDPDAMTSVEEFMREMDLSDYWTSESDSSTSEQGTRNLPPPHDHLEEELAPNVNLD